MKGSESSSDDLILTLLSDLLSDLPLDPKPSRTLPKSLLPNKETSQNPLSTNNTENKRQKFKRANYNKSMLNLTKEEIEYISANAQTVNIPPPNQRVVVFDTETTGFSKHDNIIEIGAVELVNGNRSGLFFQQCVYPRRKSASKAYQVHKLDEQYLMNYPPIRDVLSHFLRFIGHGSLLVAHNASFDLRMLNQELARLGLEELPQERVYCTMKMFNKIVPYMNDKTLDGIAFNIGLNVREGAHLAYEDAAMTAQVLQYIWLKLK